MLGHASVRTERSFKFRPPPLLQIAQCSSTSNNGDDPHEALKDREAELIAAVNANCETIGILQLAEGWGDAMEGEIWMDSSAARGMVKRKGNGNMRHVRIGHLWIQ